MKDQQTQIWSFGCQAFKIISPLPHSKVTHQNQHSVPAVAMQVNREEIDHLKKRRYNCTYYF